jgi:iron complex outermembrane recepter protein
MSEEVTRIGPSLLATVLTASLSSFAEAEGPSSRATDVSVAEELALIKEEETVSIASRHEQPISQAPSNVYVLTDDDIRHSGATDIPTLLRRVPGLEVMQTTGADFNVSVRGDNQLNANKLLVMVDGRSLYVDMPGGLFWKNLPVTLPEIKRIEVLKGPAAVVYGFNAFDGVINIITKSPEEMKGTTLQRGRRTGHDLECGRPCGQARQVRGIGFRSAMIRTNNGRNRDALAFRTHRFQVQSDYALTGGSA